MEHLAGKTVMITGASRGIGASAARLFAQAGANVALIARSEDSIANLAGEIGQQAIAIPCDVSRYWEVEKAVDAARQTFGGLDILINNAGVIEPISLLADSDPEGWGHAIDINLKGVYNGMRAVLPERPMPNPAQSSPSVQVPPTILSRPGATTAPLKRGPRC